MYYQHFNSFLCILKQTQGMVWDDPGLIQECINAIAAIPTTPTVAETCQAKADAKE